MVNRETHGTRRDCWAGNVKNKSSTARVLKCWADQESK